ncbi:MAG: hypothetical protein UZ14_CFX002001169 [Chloroflexi bacterium OLB14]|nr:MAG: hypothetical protein UZ14_CFX002001169 [Chloroflexi bacterium OLB14]
MNKNLEEIKKSWSKLSPIETMYIRLLTRWFIAKRKIKELHPKQIAIPICIIQVIVLTISIITNIEKALIVFSISSILLVGISILPLTIERKKFHWVK